MLDLTNRTIGARRANVYTAAGRVRCQSWSSTRLPNGYLSEVVDWNPPDGNQCRLYPKIRMKATPRKNIGIEVPIREELVTDTSSREYLLFAESTPIGIAIARDRASPISCNSRVAQSSCAISVETTPLV